MPGFPPPEDAPSVADQQAAASPVGLVEAPTGTSLCGLAIPGFAFNLTFRIPNPIDAFAFPPAFAFPVGLKCDLDDPIDAPFGGGRQGTLGLQDDPEFGPDG